MLVTSIHIQKITGGVGIAFKTLKYNNFSKCSYRCQGYFPKGSYRYMLIHDVKQIIQYGFHWNNHLELLQSHGTVNQAVQNALWKCLHVSGCEGGKANTLRTCNSCRMSIIFMHAEDSSPRKFNPRNIVNMKILCLRYWGIMPKWCKTISITIINLEDLF